jgi:thioredoxin 1
MMKTCWFLLCLLIATCSYALELPYNEKANAKVDLYQALSQARATEKKVLVVFGANWCPDCLRLDKTIYGASSALNKDEFVTVKVDVGNFDRNLDLVRIYGNPIKKGIPAAIILTADDKVLYKGSLSRLITPHRHIAKLLLIAAALVGLALAGVGGFVFLKKKTFAYAHGREAEASLPRTNT